MLEDYSKISWGRAKETASQIHIAFEQTSNLNHIVKANRYMYGARRIIFLGFGYHSENLRKLRPEYANDRAQEIIGMYVPGTINPKIVADGNRNGLSRNITLFPTHTITEFLHNHLTPE